MSLPRRRGTAHSGRRERPRRSRHSFGAPTVLPLVVPWLVLPGDTQGRCRFTADKPLGQPVKAKLHDVSLSPSPSPSSFIVRVGFESLIVLGFLGMRRTHTHTRKLGTSGVEEARGVA